MMAFDRWQIRVPDVLCVRVKLVTDACLLMRKKVRTLSWCLSAIAVLLLLMTGPATADNHSFELRLSLGGSWQTRNDVQIPNDSLGTRFSLDDVTGSGPLPFARAEMHWLINERHGIRVLLAPLSYTEAVTFGEPVRFAGSTFNAGETLDASYRFNSWRVGYHYSLMHSESHSLRVGATLKVRDAEIRLAQAGTESFDDDTGLVPLLYLAGSYKLSDRLWMSADLDGLAGGPGRAIDVGVALDFAVTDRWWIGAELRVLDGGADTDEIYNFARFSSSAIVVSTRF